jgi:hypothetical protein
MKQTIYHKCGHTRVLEMGLATRRSRIELAERYGASACPDCDLIELKNFEDSKSLPLLKGSPKQISWARQIRRTKLTDHLCKGFDAKNDQAGYWIEYRNRRRPLPLSK